MDEIKSKHKTQAKVVYVNNYIQFLFLFSVFFLCDVLFR